MNATSYDVVLYKIRDRGPGRPKRYNCRWRVAPNPKPFSRSYVTKSQAKAFNGDLQAAMNRGEVFDVVKGLPLSMIRAQEAETEPTWLDLATAYALFAWGRNRGNSRSGTAAMLIDITVAFLPEMPAPRRNRVRLALRHWAFKKTDAEPDAEAAALLEWVQDHCPKVSAAVEPARLRSVLDRLTLKLDGKPASAATFAKRKVILHATLEYAITEELLTHNPLDAPTLRWETPKKLKVVKVVKPQQIGNTEQVEHLLTAVSYVGAEQGPRFVPFFASMYYAMMRPEEVVALQRDQCELPEQGWGRLVLEAAEPDVGADWTDSGERHERQELKHRGVGETRPVPIPPRLVGLLRDHIRRFGVGSDGRLFRTLNGNPIQSSTYRNVWLAARDLAYGPVERGSLRLRRSYDLRHSGIVLRLYAGIPPKQVAMWAGHSVQVLHEKYDNVLEGYDVHWHRKIDAVLELGK